MIKGFKEIRSDDKDLMRVQDNAQEIFSVLAKNALLDGNIIEDVSLTAATSKKIEHGLGRDFLGWFLVRVVGTGTTIVNEVATQPMQDKFITLRSNTNTTISIYVY